MPPTITTTVPRPAVHPTAWIALALVGSALIASYLPNVQGLIGQWNRDPNNSYGFFVVPIAAAIFWSRRHLLQGGQPSPSLLWFLPLIALVATRVPLFEWNEQYVETATLPLVVACLVMALGGRWLMRAAWPSVLFLFFMLPLPPSFNALLAQPLQRVATVGSLATLQLLGLPVLAEGNVIIVGSNELEVARACNGLSMLVSFVTLITATVILIRRPLLECVLLLASTIPIAVISNILRITVMALSAYWYHEVGLELAHDWAGYAMMFVALALVWLELRVWSWLFVEVESVDPALLLRRRGHPQAGRVAGPTR